MSEDKNLPPEAILAALSLMGEAEDGIYSSVLGRLAGAGVPYSLELDPSPSGGWSLFVRIGDRRLVLKAMRSKGPRIFKSLEGVAQQVQALGAPGFFVSVGGLGQVVAAEKKPARKLVKGARGRFIKTDAKG